MSTIAPGLTWANYGSDGGDLITAAAVGGVPHPTGYPVYLLLARGFQLLPIGSLAFRTNLLSAVTVTLAAVLLFDLMATWLITNGDPNWGAALASAYAFGLAPLIWSQAVITEVYGLHILFVVLILYLSTGGPPSVFGRRWLDLSLGLTFGLSLGNHLTTILLVPLLFSALPEENSRLASALRRLAWMGLGLLPYLILPLRALQGPVVNWNNPTSWKGFFELVTAGIYRNQLLSLEHLQVWERTQAAAGLLLDQAAIPGLVVGVLGLVFYSKFSSLYRNTLWMVLVFFAFSLTYGTPDSFVYLMPVCLGFSIWIAMGWQSFRLMLPPHRVRWIPYLEVAFIVFLFWLAGSHKELVDASSDMRAENFGIEVFSRAPKDAILFTRGDRALFTLWYFHFALSERMDLAVVSTDLLQFDWYQQNLQAAYPDLQLPGPFPFAETVAAQNPGRAVCFVEYAAEPQIQCRPADRAP